MSSIERGEGNGWAGATKWGGVGSESKGGGGRGNAPAVKLDRAGPCALICLLFREASVPRGY